MFSIDQEQAEILYPPGSVFTVVSAVCTNQFGALKWAITLTDAGVDDVASPVRAFKKQPKRAVVVPCVST